MIRIYILEEDMNIRRYVPMEDKKIYPITAACFWTSSTKIQMRIHPPESSFTSFLSFPIYEYTDIIKKKETRLAFARWVSSTSQIIDLDSHLT